MKYLVLAISLMASVTFFATATHAAQPCKTIVEACLAVGAIQPGVPKKVMLEKCVKPIISGQNIEGVNVDPSVIKACKAKVGSR